jgi:hypothetical protein
MKASVILRAARDKIAPPGKWTQGRHARDFEGRGVNAMDKSAVCWCALGAVEATAGGSTSEPLRYLIRVIGSGYVSFWNDVYERKHPEVLTALTRAAELAESEGR